MPEFIGLVWCRTAAQFNMFKSSQKSVNPSILHKNNTESLSYAHELQQVFRLFDQTRNICFANLLFSLNYASLQCSFND